MQANLRSPMGEIQGAAHQLACAAQGKSQAMLASRQSVNQQNLEIEQAVTAVTEMSAAADEVAT